MPSLEVKVAVILAFIIQTAPDIKKNLQTVERFRKKSLRDLVIVAERVFNGRESTKEKPMREQRQQTHNLAKILLAAMAKPEDCKTCLKKMAFE